MAQASIYDQVLDPASRANPYPLYAELRKTPVARQADGSYVVSTYREITSILHDPRVSSDLRNRANAAAAPEVAVYELGMITSDPPEHDRVRRATMRHFGPPHSPELVSSQEAEIKRIDAKLSNPAFLANADEDVVEADREKREETVLQVEKIAEALERLKQVG